jgi:hypothetical protein
LLDEKTWSMRPLGRQSCRCAAWLAVVLLVSTSPAALGSIASLRIVSQPSVALGGTPFSVQPVLEALDSSGSPLTTMTSSTVVTARIESPGTGTRFLRLDTVGVVSTDDFVEVAFCSNTTSPCQYAVFDGLLINEAPADNVTILFSISSGGPAVWVVSDPFNTEVGPPVKVGLSRQPGAADGGRVFRAQPVVEVQDAGGNRVATDNDTVVSASLVVDASADGNATLSGVGASAFPLQITMINGEATFIDLSIDKEGVGYVIEFNTTAHLTHPATLGATNASVQSLPLTVGTGPTARLRFVQQPAGARGGHPFVTQPVLELVDAGGNRNVRDNDSFVTVSIYEDPTPPGVQAVLGPRYLYHEYSVNDIQASVIPGSEYITLTGTVNVLDLIPPLQHGDRVMLGPEINRYPYAYNLGAQIRLVRSVGSEHRLRMDAPWTGPAMTNVTLVKQLSTHTVRVSQGVATFTNLTIDRAASQYRLIFVSSLRPDPQGTLLGRGRKGFGKTGSGYGYGLDVEDRLALYPNDYNPPFDFGPQDVGEPNIASSEAAADGSISLPWPTVVPPRNITLVSNKFDVTLSDPHHLRIDVPAAVAWAGGEPFGQQPIVSVRDAGDNLLITIDGPTVEASILHDPTGSALPALTGFTSATVVQGRAEFINLGIPREGANFTLLFTANVPGWGTLSVFQPVSVWPSAEWSVHLPDAQPGDRFGEAVAVYGDVLVVGAPHDRAPETEVQVIETLADADELVAEIQAIGTVADAQVEVQELRWTTRVNATGVDALGPHGSYWHPGVDGTFQVVWGGRITPAISIATAHAAYIQVMLEQELPRAGSGPLSVSETRTAVPVLNSTGHVYAVDQTTVWSVTFRTHDTGPVELMVVLSAGLTGTSGTPFLPESAAIGGTGTTLYAVPVESAVTVVRTQAASVIGGTFTLSLSDGQGGVLTTPAIAHDITAIDLKDVIEAHLGTGSVQVSRRPLAPSATYPFPGPVYGVGGVGGYLWLVTFTPTSSTYDPPTFVGNSTLLTGPNAQVWAGEVRRGRAPIAGSFSIHFRGAGPSPVIPYDATEDEMKVALETLSSIVEVNVTRTGPTSSNGYRWSVTFLRVRNMSEPWNGTFIDDEGDSHYSNLPALEGDVDGITNTANPFPGFVALPNSPAAGQLTGSNARVNIIFMSSNEVTQPWLGARHARAGVSAGSVTVAEREYRTWVVQPSRGQGARLKGRDTSAQDQFGWAVDVDANATVVVGAPGAAAVGSLEQQRIRCRADGGSFTLTWRGFQTAPVAFNATALAVKEALEALSPIQQVHVAVELDNVPGGLSLSAAQAAALPVCVASNATGDNGVQGAEMLGRATLVTFVWPQDGDMEAIIPGGASLTLSADGQATTSSLSPALSVEDDVVRGTRKSSGFNATGDTSGAAYVFTIDTYARNLGSGNQWTQAARLEAPDEHRSGGDMFGAAVAVDNGDTIAVGAPQDDEAGQTPLRGAVYIFLKVGAGATDIDGRPVTKMSESGEWGLSQRLIATTAHTSGAMHGLFGSAVSLFGSTLAVGAPGLADGEGRVFVFKRLPALSQSFLIDQEIVPLRSMIPAADILAATPVGFGTCVSVDDDVLVAGAPGALHPYRNLRLASDYIGDDTGVALLYDRPGYHSYFVGKDPSNPAVDAVGSPRAVLAPSAAKRGDRVGMSCSVSGHVAVVSSWEPTKAPLGARKEVQVITTGIVTVDPKLLGHIDSAALQATQQQATEWSDVLSGFFAVQWRRRQVLSPWRDPVRQGGRGVGGSRLPTPLTWKPLETRRLPADATARDVRRALEEDLGTGRVNVTRVGPDKRGGYQWFVTFTAIDDDLSPADVPLLQVRTDALLPRAGRSPSASSIASSSSAAAAPTVRQAVATVKRVSSPPVPLRGAAYLWRRDAIPNGQSDPAGLGGSGGFGAEWWETAVLEPFSHQRADQFGFAVSVQGNTAVVGAPNRDQANSGVFAGVAQTFDLGLLNLRIEGAADPSTGKSSVIDVSEGAGRVVFQVTHCSRSTSRWPCTVPERPATSLGLIQVQSALFDAVSGSDWGVYDGPMPYPIGGLGPASSSASAADAVRAPAHGPAFCKTGWSSTDACAFLRLGDRFGLANLTAFDYSGHADFAMVRGAPLALVPPESADINTTVVVAAESESSEALLRPRQTLAVALNLTDSTSVPVDVSDDSIVESIDETFHARLWLPGIRPTYDGPLWAPCLIADDGDGSEGLLGYAQHLYASDNGADLAMSTPWTAGSGNTNPLWDDNAEAQARPFPEGQFGSAIAQRGSVAVVGAPLHVGGSIAQVGRAAVLTRSSGVWTVSAALAPPSGFDVQGARFGAGAALSDDATVAIVTSSGQSGTASAIGVHVFRYWTGSTPSLVGWQHEASLRPVLGSGREGGGVGPGDRFGVVGTVAVSEAPSASTLSASATKPLIIAVGCSGKEAVFVFRSALVLEGDASSRPQVTWRQTNVLRSSAWRPFSYLETWQMIPESFGYSVAASVEGQDRGLFVIGAPLAEHGFVQVPTTFKDILEMREHTAWHAQGAVYVFQFVEGPVTSSVDALRGTFPSTAWASVVGWPGGDNAELTSGNAPSAHWRGLNPSLTVIPGHAMDDAGITGGAYVSEAAPGMWVEHARLITSDRKQGDGFGSAVAVHGAQLVVGAPGSSAQPRTTWDFESGTLRGWATTGDAFDNQPTFGDNPLMRPGYPTALGASAPSSARLRGRYFVGTFEDYMGDLTAIAGGDPTQTPPSSQLPGTVQGDAPTGTMTSDPFLIAGDRISFLVGGGCDPHSEFVTLLVDGLPHLRATGGCDEEMRRVFWHVEEWIGRAGQIRVSDLSSSSPWGHINVDDFRFSWAVGSFVETPQAGAAYAFRRFSGSSREPCNGDLGIGNSSSLRCGWEEQARLTASDKRRGARFGESIAVDNRTGLVAIGAPGHSATFPDWFTPGFTPGVMPGPFGMSQLSVRPDAGLNAIDHVPGGSYGEGRWVRPGYVVSSGGIPGGHESTVVDENAQEPPPPYKGLTGAVGTLAGNLWARAVTLTGGSLAVSQFAAQSYGSQAWPQADTGLNTIELAQGIGLGFRSPWLWSSLSSRGGLSNPGRDFVSPSTAGVSSSWIWPWANKVPRFGSSGPQSSLGGYFDPRSDVAPGLVEMADGAQRAGGRGPLDPGQSPFEYHWDSLAANSLTDTSPAHMAVAEALVRRGMSDGRWLQDGGPVRHYAPSLARHVPHINTGASGAGTVAMSGLGHLSPSGTVYVFRRQPERRGTEPQQRLIEPPRWERRSQQAMLWAAWMAPGSGTASALSLDGDSLLIGSATDSSGSFRAGSVTAVDLALSRAGFENVDYAASRTSLLDLDTNSQSYRIAAVGSRVDSYSFSEGHHLGKMVVPVYRGGDRHGGGAGDIQRTLHVHYSTRGVTAQGVPASKAAACKLLPKFERSRARCGDYVDIQGVLEFAPGVQRRDIVIPLVDDDCFEAEPELLQIHLSTPGGVAFLGEDYAVTVRIDDDDANTGQGTCLRPLLGH